MAGLMIPVTFEQLRDLALASFRRSVLAKSGRRGSQPELTDEQIQAEVDAVRTQRREDRQRASGG